MLVVSCVDCCMCLTGQETSPKWWHQGETVLTDLKCSVPLLQLKTGWDSVVRLEMFSTTATAEDITVGQCWQTWNVQYHCYCWRHQRETVLTDLKCSVPLLLLKTSGWDSVDRLELFSTTATAEDIRVGQCWQTWNAWCHCFSSSLYSTIIICVAVVIIWQDGEWSQKRRDSWRECWQAFDARSYSCNLLVAIIICVVISQGSERSQKWRHSRGDNAGGLATSVSLLQLQPSHCHHHVRSEWSQVLQGIPLPG